MQTSLFVPCLEVICESLHFFSHISTLVKSFKRLQVAKVHLIQDRGEQLAWKTLTAQNTALRRLLWDYT